MPGFVSVQWTIDGVEQEPQSSFFEQTRFEDLTVGCDVPDGAGELHVIRARLVFDPPLETVRSAIELPPDA